MNVTDGSCRVLQQACFSCDMHCDMAAVECSGGLSRFLCRLQAILCDCAMALDNPTFVFFAFTLDVPWPLHIVIGG